MQQRFLGQEKEYVALKELADEIASLLGVRIFHMRRLNRVLPGASANRVDLVLQEYDEVLKHWNERLPSFYIRLPMLAPDGLAQRLENTMQAELVKIGASIESLVAKRKAGEPVSKTLTNRIENDLNVVQGRSISFNKYLLGVMHSRRTDVYYGKRFEFSPQNFKHFSTWNLVKALFVRDINSLSVIRATLDS